MFLLALSAVFCVFVALVTYPERWAEKFTAFLREHNVYHG